MRVIGLSGRICCGKDAAAAYLADLGFSIVDVDRLGHDALVRGAGKISDTLGDAVTAPGGGIDREALAKLVFADREALRKLEGIVHPLMAERCREIIEEGRRTDTSIVLNAAVLVRMGLETLCDAVVFISAPLLIRWYRAVAYRKIGTREFLRRNASQADVGMHNRGSLPADRVFSVSNSGSIRALYKNLDSILKLLDGTA
jgi:dephospho-CoA kinase